MTDKIFMDLHTHTVACGHAYSTLQENIDRACAIGLKYLGMSEHAPALPGGTHPFFFTNYRSIPRYYGDTRLFCGTEVNIMDYDGHFDLDDRILAKMDYVIASLHYAVCTPGTIADHTRASIEAMKSPYVKILGHPDDSRLPVDYEELVPAAKEYKVALEVNNASLNPLAVRKGGRENITRLLETCKKYNTPVIMGTDSHFHPNIGVFDDAIALIEEVGFPKELVLNFREDGILDVVNCKV